MCLYSIFSFPVTSQEQKVSFDPTLKLMIYETPYMNSLPYVAGVDKYIVNVNVSARTWVAWKYIWSSLNPFPGPHGHLPDPWGSVHVGKGSEKIPNMLAMLSLWLLAVAWLLSVATLLSMEMNSWPGSPVQRHFRCHTAVIRTCLCLWLPLF